MRIAIVGYGKMGKAIEKIALERGHQIALIIDADNANELSKANLKIDVAIEFSTPSSAFDNILKCLDLGFPVVSGTTGWLDKLPQIKATVEATDGSFFYASNYSLGVNIFFRLNKWLANIMGGFSQYDVSIEEIHHIHKLDQPSGTAITLADSIIQSNSKYRKWVNEPTNQKNELKIKSIRSGEVPGTHTVSYASDLDVLEIKHEAKDRAAFALGAVLVAEWILDKKGILTMDDFITI